MSKGMDMSTDTAGDYTVYDYRLTTGGLGLLLDLAYESGEINPDLAVIVEDNSILWDTCSTSDWPMADCANAAAAGDVRAIVMLRTLFDLAPIV